MGGSSGPSNTTTTVKNEPPAWLQPYGESTLQTGAGLAAQPYQPYPGQTVAPLAPEHQAALYMGGQRAVNGSAVGNAAQQMATSTLQGGYFDNPYLAEQIRLAQSEVMPQIGYMSAAGGSFGNSGMNQAAAKQYGDISQNMRFANYNAERDRQMQAANLAPNLAQMDWTDVQQLMGLGDVARTYQQEVLGDQESRWMEQLQWPYQQMDWFANLLRGVGYGSGAGTATTTAPNPNQQSNLASLVGGGAMLGGLYDVLNRA